MTFRYAALVLAVSSLVFAHQVDQPGFRHDAWQTDQGLPHDVVRTMTQTPDGYLWIGMTNSLGRFDGARIVPVAQQKLIATQVTGSATDSRGRLVVATLAGVYRVEGGQLTALAERSRVSSVRSIAADRQGYLWVGAEHGLFRVSADGGPPVQFIDKLFIHAIAVGPDGSVWAATRRGLFRIPPGATPADAPFQTWLSDQIVTSVYADASGVLAGSDGHGMYSIPLDGEAVSIFAHDLGRHVMAIQKDRFGDLWVGTWERGLFRISNSEVSQPVGSLTEGIQVVALFEDREGNVWAATRGSGLHRIRRQTVRNLSSSGGLPHPLTWAAAESPDGTVWVGTDGGLSAIRDGKVRTWTSKDGLPGQVVTTVAAAADGTVYAGTPGYGIARIRGGKVEKLHIPAALGSTLNHVYAARDGRLWISTMRGILVVEGETVVRHFSKETGLPSNGVRSVFEDRQGVMWASTQKGVARIQGSEVTAFDQKDGLAINGIRSVSQDHNDTIWVSTQGGGLCRMQPSTLR